MTNPCAPAYLVRGQVMHERLRPAQHRFVYPVFYVRLNLARLSAANNAWFGVNRPRLMSLRTRDYGPRDGSDLDGWMRAQLADAGLPCDGEIWLQTFPRLFGFVFNPVSFWLCHDSSGALRAVLAEVNNTFGETHRYLLADGERKAITPDTRLVCAKAMHVSPFCEVRGSYRFRFRDTEKTTLIGIDYEDGAENCESPGVLIHTTVGGRLQAMTSAVALRALLTQPFLTFGIVAKIHWQAWKLWRKRVPFFRKPARPTDSAVATANFNKEMSP
ncbi:MULTISPECIES: DUF1365 domain-containing protein [unclassified Herbaspirillum]|uniref:DUF1365 domain-containing protein n=1 Tax=unclassified Herbaspirillum TaxID=2624150 RepID=UPI00142F9489|nr:MULTISPECIES: DUF1365 domain-containing protein [unclassified Herbaspirillum]